MRITDVSKWQLALFFLLFFLAEALALWQGAYSFHSILRRLTSFLSKRNLTS